MSDKNNSVTLETTISEMLVKSKKAITAIVIAAVVVIVGVILGVTLHSKSIASGIEQVDTIYYVLTKDSADLAEGDLTARFDDAASKLEPLAKKSGIVGIRASLLLADIHFQKGEFEKAKNLWLRAASLKKNSYTYSWAYFNASVCAEKLDDLDSAVAYMDKAAENEDFALIDEVLFNLGRLNESKGSFDSAKVAYEKVNDLHPSSNWAYLSKSRLIQLKVDGKIQ